MAKYKRRLQGLSGSLSAMRKRVVSDPGTVKILPDANYWIRLARALERTLAERELDQTAAVDLHDRLRSRETMADGRPLKLLTSDHILSRVELKLTQSSTKGAWSGPESGRDGLSAITF